MKFSNLILFLLLIVSCTSEQAPLAEPAKETQAMESPDVRYQLLFTDVQTSNIFTDSKTFVDCTPKYTTNEILLKYEQEKIKSDFDLKQFVYDHFNVPKKRRASIQKDSSHNVIQYLDAFWDVLKRNGDQSNFNTRIALPNAYILASEDAREVYYAESYFTMLGLQASGQTDLIRSMLDNFTYLLDQKGFIPLANRTYYSGRSQAPYLSFMVELLAKQKGDHIYKKYVQDLEKEYRFWMDGKVKLNNELLAYRRVVKLPNGSILNRYWNDEATPRPEFYKEDIALAKSIEHPNEKVYQDIGAASESAWGFNSRWFANGQYLTSLQTTNLIPVDLNCLLYHLEVTIMKSYEIIGETTLAIDFKNIADKRKEAILHYCWNPENYFFTDYNFILHQQSSTFSLAGTYPLFTNIATPSMADSIASVIQKDFLKAGGLVTSLNQTGQEWDAPYGWAPLQWISIEGLRNYKQQALADTIQQRWVELNLSIFNQTGKFLDKYNVVDTTIETALKELPDQNGFSWTNGVLLDFLKNEEHKKTDNQKN